MKTNLKDKHLHLDCSSGVAGDMLLGSLLDLGVPVEPVVEALGQIGLDSSVFQAKEVKRCGLAGLGLNVAEATGDEKRPVHHAEMRARLENSNLQSGVRDRSISVMDRLARAEAKVHSVKVEEVHYHELGGIDTLVDLVGVCAALHWLNPVSVTASPVALGGGRVKTDHGWLPVPAPATLQLLKGSRSWAGPNRTRSSRPPPVRPC